MKNNEGNDNFEMTDFKVNNPKGFTERQVLIAGFEFTEIISTPTELVNHIVFTCSVFEKKFDQVILKFSRGDNFEIEIISYVGENVHDKIVTEMRKIVKEDFDYSFRAQIIMSQDEIYMFLGQYFCETNKFKYIELSPPFIKLDSPPFKDGKAFPNCYITGWIKTNE
jgi:hypothetical protein